MSAHMNDNGWIDFCGDESPVGEDVIVECQTPFGVQISYAKRHRWHEVTAYKVISSRDSV